MKFSTPDSGRLVYTMNTAYARKNVTDDEIRFWQYVVLDEEYERQTWFKIAILFEDEEVIVGLN